MKLKIRMKRTFRLEELLMKICAFCVLSFALLEHASVSIPLFSMVKMPLLLLGGMCMVLQAFPLLGHLKKKRYFGALCVVVLLCAMLFVSAVANRDAKLGEDPMKDTIRLVLFILELYFLSVWVAQTGRSKYILDFLFHYCLVLTIATDLLLFSRVITFTDGHFETYLIGTKFAVSYIHMNLLTLWFIRNKQRLYSDRKAKRVILIGVPVAMVVLIFVDCITGILGCLILLVLFMLLNTPVQRKLMKLSSPVLLGVTLLISVAFPFVSESIMRIPAVTYIVETVFNRDATLTGRLNIFQIFGERMQENWLWGFGYGNGNVVATTLFGYANAQNAMLHWVLQVGVPATVLLALIIMMVFRRIAWAPSSKQIMPFVILVYVYVLLGTIETTFSMSFLVWVAMIFILINEKKTPAISGN